MPSSSARARTRRSSRLLAVCTSGVLAAGAFALGPAGIAHADSGAPHHITRTLPKHTTRPTLTLPKRDTSPARHSFAKAAGQAPLTTPRFDVDGDGGADILTQEGNGHIAEFHSGAQTWADKGLSPVKYLDILTPGEESTAHNGPEVLSLTTTGKLSLWDNSQFPAGSPLWTGSGWNVYNKVVAVGDINGDGLGDLLARTRTGDLYLYKGTGSLTEPFTVKEKVGSGFGGYDQLTGAGDITATGYESLVARDLNGDLWYYRLDGTATDPLSAKVKIGYHWNTYNQIIGVGDEPGAAGSLYGRKPNGDLYFYMGSVTGTGTDTLTPSVQVGTEWTDELISSAGSNPFWGKNNLFAVNKSGTVYYYSGLKNGKLAPRVTLFTGDTGTKLVGPVSLSQQDEEPLLEIYQGTLYNDTDGFPGVIGTGWGSYSMVLGPGDLSGDGRSDLLARDTSGVLWDLTGKGDGTFNARVRVGPSWNQYNQIVGAGDINGDGYADIVARTTDGHLYFYAGTGSASAPFKPRVLVGPGWNTYTRLAAPGDLDGDGRADIVAANSAGQLFRYSGTGRSGTATFAAKVQIGTSGWNAFTQIV